MKITICMGSSCYSRGNHRNRKVVDEYLQEHGLKDKVVFGGCLCLGKCENGPLVEINDTVYEKVDEGIMLDLLEEYFWGENKK